MKKEFCLIQDVFAESKFKLFKNYSIKHQLIYLKDISPEILENFAKQRGVGAVKMTALIERLAGPISTLPLDVFISENKKRLRDL